MKKVSSIPGLAKRSGAGKYQVSSLNKNKVLFLALFVILGFVALQIPIATIKGSRVPFTLFDLFSPITGAFLGTPLGIVSVVLMQLVNLVSSEFRNVDDSSLLKLIATLRFLPMAFGVWYFAQKAQKSKNGYLMLLVPLISIAVFNLHPIGRTVWFYSLFWLIPVVVWPLRERFLVLRSLGATFSAHAVGGAVWIWAFNLPASVWISLIPVVILERSIFALGISASYILVNNILGYLSARRLLPKDIIVEKRYQFKI